ncbi:hypothetical protein TRFO_33936 [Tritrichomonas foetus]|uniref:BTB domain-containing protein n=1 Tax=Tritrichomonas foetus TaxID=1144522 RepID=A0A1J4JKA5_9EUKA|nr:hypothetical protein TRFO_33936 [Tritrichomonas foetus]|eukprot:OHS99570.1 hypothetical protein TRFO_33936 [Tritrichomonas foetus]
MTIIQWRPLIHFSEMMKKKNEKNNNEKNKDNPNFQYNILKIEKLEENLEEEEDQIFLVYRGEKIETKKSLLFTKCRYFRKHIELFHQKEIDVSDKYSSETFRNFISSMKSQELEIHENTIFEYFELSSRYEYHELYFSLEKYLHSVPFLSHIVKDLISIDSISNSTKSSKSSKSMSEDIISNNFDENDKGNFEEDLNEKKEEIIAKHFEESYRSGLLRKMKYSRLYRILSSPSLFISNHHHLFEFIISLFDDFIKHENAKKGKANHINFDKDKEKSILQTFSTFLNYEEMNESEINKLISHPLFCDCFQPKYSTTIISRLLKQQQSQLILQSRQETLFHELEKKYESQLTRFEEMKNQIYKELDTKFSEQHQQINEILTRNEQQTQEIESKFSTLEQSFFDHKTEIRKDIDTRIKSKITENSTLMKKEYFDSLRQEIDSIKQKLTNIEFYF